MVVKEGGNPVGADVNGKASAKDQRFGMIDFNSPTAHQLDREQLEGSTTSQRAKSSVEILSDHFPDLDQE